MVLSAGVVSRSELHDERDWLSAAREGDARALERFYNEYRRQVFALCYRMLGRTEDAEDAMQAAFVRAFRALPGFRGDSLARTWLYRIAVNESVTILRQRRRNCEQLDEDVSCPDGVAQIQTRIAVNRSLSHIRPEQRAILVLRYWEDMGYEEIAEVLNFTVPAVKMRLNRARSDFRKAYEGHS